MTPPHRFGPALLCGLCCLGGPATSPASPASSNNIVVSEVLYYPPVTSTTERDQGFLDQNDFEFIELLNISSETVTLDGAGFSDGIELALTGDLAPGEYIVAVRNLGAFQLRYGTDIRLAGEYSGKLSNEGERVELTNATGGILLQFEYDTAANWPDIVVPGNTGGYSMELKLPLTAPNPDSGANWQLSYNPEGTPGRAPDSDNNGLIDFWEIEHFGVMGIDPNADPDLDGSANLEEFTRRTNPKLPDTDTDGLLDGVETDTGIYLSATDTGTDPNRPDTDNDGLLDSVETDTGIYLNPSSPGTNPTDRDTDKDRFIDGLEVNVGTNPVDPVSFPVPPEILSFTASAAQITIGETITLAWTATEANHIQLTPDFDEVANPNGSVTFTPAQLGTHNYTLTASNLYRTVSRQISFRVFPEAPPVIFSFEAVTSAIGRGGRTILQWSTDGILDTLEISPEIGPVTGNSIVVAPSISRPLVERWSDWSYLDTGADPGADWTTPGYDDSAWYWGPGPLGYGEDELQTILEFGGDPSNKHITYHFRRTFVVTDVRQLSTVTLQLMRDDGAEVHLNGNEILRDNLPPGPLNHQTLASQHAQDDGRDYIDHFVNPALLVEGINFLAVAIHQATTTSADIKFDLALIATRRAVHPVTYTLTARNDAGASTRQTTVEVDSGTEELVSYHQEWSYDDVGVGVGTNWFQSRYNDNSWPIGEGVLGVEDRGTALPLIRTPLLLPIVSYSPVVYFRTRFNLLALPPPETLLQLTHLVDDGIVVYLNGQEIHRIGTEPGAEYGDRIIGDAEFEGPFPIDPSALTLGENIVAAELHQPYLTTTDIVWGGKLTLSSPSHLTLQIQRDNGQIVISWDHPGPILQTAPTPSGPWIDLITPTNSITLPPLEPAAFYRLR